MIEAWHTRRMLAKLFALVKDVTTHPEKYRKGFVVPAAIVVYAVSQYAGADSTITLEVVATLAALGVYRIPNVPV